MARAPACCHDTAACCRLAAIESSFHRRSRQPPATHGVQPVVRLRCGQEARAGGGCTTCLVDGATWRAMASTRVMVPKDCNHSGRWRAAHLPAHQRGRWMDGALQVRGPSHGRALQLQRWPMRFVSAHIYGDRSRMGRGSRACAARERERCPELRVPHMNVLLVRPDPRGSVLRNANLDDLNME